MGKYKIIFLGLIFFSNFFNSQSLSAADKTKIISEPSQKIDVAYRIYRTDNIWNQLLLDTKTGRLWQLSFGVDSNTLRATVPINEKYLAKGESATIGRFTLYPTDNMWTFLLLDQIDGRVWQCQFGITIGDQTIIAIEDFQKK
jgi:hypothetical protein